jgi:hypothetical protein
MSPRNQAVILLKGHSVPGPLAGVPMPRVVNENLAHQPRRYPKEMRAALPVWTL